jgi:transposase InsO family protein
MTQAGIHGLPGLVRVKRLRGIVTAEDLVNRKFHRLGPDELWVTDITQHRTREGWVYCAAVLDAFSRRIVGWSIDSRQDSTLVVNALDMAIRSRRPEPGGIVHADHGTQGEFNWSSQHFDLGGVRRGHGGLEFEDQRCSGGSASAVAR